MDAKRDYEAPYNEELFSRPSTEAKIFVSSHMGRRNVLRAERKAAADAIESTGFARAWYWERDAHAGPYSSERLCVGAAATSDGLVLILARKLTRVTRMEYQAAYGAGVPCFIFFKEGVRRDPDVNAFIANGRRRDAVVVSFGSPRSCARGSSMPFTPTPSALAAAAHLRRGCTGRAVKRRYPHRHGRSRR